MKTRSKRHSQKGQALTEYILIIAVVAIASIALITIFGNQIRTLIGASSEQIGGNASSQNTLLETDSAVTRDLNSF